ncbi:hypothetical protein ARMSODRAFT_747154 [Armillaria solidipes]|uniref:Uncharacterized protein n=1 Tax=Armillaria solidipes TaxID=1076256 RepID=A0A2H3C7V1_9AGAR|nr:hypothetical protein ARMSODRAFT_747154 [Armillaria solidipes]
MPGLPRTVKTTLANHSPHYQKAKFGDIEGWYDDLVQTIHYIHPTFRGSKFVRATLTVSLRIPADDNHRTSSNGSTAMVFQRRPPTFSSCIWTLSLSVDVDNIEENSCLHKQALTAPRTQHPAPTTFPLERTGTHDSSSDIKSSVDGQGIYRHSCNEKGGGR